MPITAFNSFTDGLDPNRRNREHFIATIRGILPLPGGNNGNSG
jgi:hypothetical protein